MIPGVISGVVNLGRDNDARLLRLRTALGLGTGFQLVIVEVEPGPIRKEVIRRIQTWSGHASIGTLAVVSLDPDATLAVQLGGKSGAIITGLEPRCSSDPARDWIAELNWSRDALPGLVSGPLVLIVSQAMHQGLFERASDLYSWRRHAARVAITVRELAVPLVSLGDRYWLRQRDGLSTFLADILDHPPTGTVLVDRIILITGPALLCNLADVLLQLGDEPAASRVLDIVTRWVSSLPDDDFRKPMLERSRVLRASCELMRRDLPAARARLSEIAPGTAVGVLLWGKLVAIEGTWDTAIAALSRAVELAHAASEPESLTRARECLCQVAFARGDFTQVRREIADLIDATGSYMDQWGTGMLLRLAAVAGDLYPDEIAPLLDSAFAAAESSSRTEMMVVVQCLRAKCAWLLERTELAHRELAQAERWTRSEDPPEIQALLALCQAGVVLMAGSTSEDQVAVRLARARELFRPTAPRQAAVAGSLLGDFWKSRERSELAVTAYQVAVEDAQRAGDHALAAETELCALGAAVESQNEQESVGDQLRALAERFHAADHTQSEGSARVELGRRLLRRGFREAAVIEFERARACFTATTDATREDLVVRLLENGK